MAACQQARHSRPRVRGPSHMGRRNEGQLFVRDCALPRRPGIRGRGVEGPRDNAPARHMLCEWDAARQGPLAAARRAHRTRPAHNLRGLLGDCGKGRVGERQHRQRVLFRGAPGAHRRQLLSRHPRASDIPLPPAGREWWGHAPRGRLPSCRERPKGPPCGLWGALHGQGALPAHGRGMGHARRARDSGARRVGPPRERSLQQS
mmetsp:Transcript_300/g.800  ORF Transcript_300/g.800 Transcript_300/m.800 type:complete len:204 (-) Transcript_300:382-993(-)